MCRNPCLVSDAKRLTCGAEIAAPVLYRDTLDGAATDGARFTSSMSNPKITMGCAQLAIRANVGIHAGAFAADARLKSSADAII